LENLILFVVGGANSLVIPDSATSLCFVDRVWNGIIEKSINPDVVYLICEYDETIIWKNSAGETLTGLAHIPKGKFIVVTNTRNPSISYTCSLQNAVSEKTSDPVYERDLFEGEMVI